MKKEDVKKIEGERFKFCSRRFLALCDGTLSWWDVLAIALIIPDEPLDCRGIDGICCHTKELCDVKYYRLVECGDEEQKKILEKKKGE